MEISDTSTADLNVLRNRIRQLFSFLRALVQQKFPAPRQIKERSFYLPLSQLPDHESVRFSPSSDCNEEPLLYVRRPILISCPKPPEIIYQWLMKGWDNCLQLPEVRKLMPTGIDEDGKQQYENFNDDTNRISAFNDWLNSRRPWAEERVRAESALKLFEELYTQFASLEKDGGQTELLIGDGLLNWRLPTGGIHHPILLKRVELRFDHRIPAFELINSERPVEIYNSLLMATDGVDIRRIQERSRDLNESQYHPLGGGDTSAFLKALIQSLSPSTGEFLSSPSVGEKDHPRMWREPFLFSSKRNMSYGLIIDKILQDIETSTSFPTSLAAIIGIHQTGGRLDRSSRVLSELNSNASREEGLHILLANHANADQIKIIKRFHQTGLVHVQGPPGTGKTHTIGNVIGHLLAQGKRILVTSHTDKALRVLREKVPGPLQSLCVSVLNDGVGSRKQLEETINNINNRMTRHDPQELLENAQMLYRERENLIVQEKSLRGRLRSVLDAEYNPIQIDGITLDPSAASREVASTRIGNDWIPGNAEINEAPPITEEELCNLYASNGQLTQFDEIELKIGIPNILEVPSPELFSHLVSEYNELLTKDLRIHEEYWIQSSLQYSSLEAAADKLITEFDQHLIKLSWRPNAITAGKQGGQSRQLWETLCLRIERCVDIANQLALLIHLRPAFNENVDYQHAVEICQQIQSHLSTGGKLGTITLLMRGDWKQFIRTSRVAAGEPHRKEHFEALRLEAELKIARSEVSHLWDQLIANNGGKTYVSLGDQPEASCNAIVHEIRRSLNWYSTVWSPLLHQLLEEGFNWQLLESRVPRQETPLADYLQIEKIVTEHFPEIVCSELSRRRMRELEMEFTRQFGLFEATLEGLGGKFIQAIQKRDSLGYVICHARLAELQVLKPIFERRQLTLRKIKASLPQWEQAISNRQPPHDQTRQPGVLLPAWRWLRLASELKRRQEENVMVLQNSLDKCQGHIRQITLELIENLTWGRQIAEVRSRPELQQSLAGWLELQRRLASTRIKSVQNNLKRAAQREMTKCTEAVPVWIMPLHAVAENLDPTTTKFDVVIIDEASQADLMALIPMYMAKDAIIVGDHEQTTPEAVGVQLAPIHNLIDAYLQGIPNCELFDVLTSVYDLARRCFGQTIMLTEHFRCVPEIIAFSNNLSYEGQIRPLREESTSQLKPSVIAYPVNGVSHRKQNDVEADAIVRLIIAMTKHPLYSDATIGVITLLGEEQADNIDAKLRAELPASEYLKRRIVCGNPPQFQGDERDVIFLSMVDSIGDGGDGFLRRRGDGAFGANKKRYNVAASRARDQLWVVYSMDPQCHLRHGDIRRDLILHAQNPNAAMQEISLETARADSVFEIRVMEMLAQKGYRVKAQWKVGYHRIDIVVVGQSKRLAVECDGDRWHPPAKRDEDLERQGVLERLGWKFVRIRGTSFFYNPVTAMKPVFEKLDEMGIECLGPESSPQNTSDRTLIVELEKLAWPERFCDQDTSDEPVATEEITN